MCMNAENGYWALDDDQVISVACIKQLLGFVSWMVYPAWASFA